jgi:hypothetical protein
LTDALAVYALLAKLDPSLGTGSFKSILGAAVVGTAAGLAKVSRGGTAMNDNQWSIAA